MPSNFKRIVTFMTRNRIKQNEYENAVAVENHL